MRYVEFSAEAFKVEPGTLFELAPAEDGAAIPFGMYDGVLYEVSYWELCPEGPCGAILLYLTSELSEEARIGLNYKLSGFGELYIAILYPGGHYVNLDFASEEALSEAYRTDPIQGSERSFMPAPVGVITIPCAAVEQLTPVMFSVQDTSCE